MDPTSVAQLEGRKRRWLHLSVAMRARSIRTFTRVLCLFGDDSTGNAFPIPFGRTSSSSSPSTDCERAISLVVGCLVEQSGHHNNTMDGADKFDDDWGSKEERVDMIVACANCLSITLTSCGGFLGTSIRRLIESVTLSALLLLSDIEPQSRQLMSWGPVKVEILHLASNCVTTPWNDGSSSSLSDRLVHTARQLERDMDLSVCHAAKEAIRICDALQIPRAPALLFVSNRAIESETGHLDASSIAEGIERIREDNARVSRKEEEDKPLKGVVTELKRKESRKETTNTVPKRQKVHLGDEEMKVSLPFATLVQHSCTPSQQNRELTKDVETEPISRTLPSENDLVESSHDDPQTHQEQSIILSQSQAENEDDSKEVIDGGLGGVEIDEDDDLPEIFAGGGPDSEDDE
jgi:hypothetical protein